MAKQEKKIQSKELVKAWRQFTKAMYDELALREANGWEGWDDNDEFSDRNLIARAERNLRKFRRNPNVPGHGIDVANLMTFVWYRHKL